MTTRRIWPVLLAALALAGCGGDDEESTRAGTETSRDTPAQSKEKRAEPEGDAEVKATPREKGAAPLGTAEFRRRVNALCAADKKALKAAPEPTTPEGIAPYFEKLLELAKKSEPLYRAIEPPAALRERYADYLRFSERGETLFRGLVADLKATENPVAVLQRSLPKLGRFADEGNRKSRRLGLEDCVEEIAPQAESPETTS